MLGGKATHPQPWWAINVGMRGGCSLIGGTGDSPSALVGYNNVRMGGGCGRVFPNQGGRERGDGKGIFRPYKLNSQFIVTARL